MIRDREKSNQKYSLFQVDETLYKLVFSSKLVQHPQFILKLWTPNLSFLLWVPNYRIYVLLYVFKRRKCRWCFCWACGNVLSPIHSYVWIWFFFFSGHQWPLSWAIITFYNFDKFYLNKSFSGCNRMQLLGDKKMFITLLAPSLQNYRVSR